MQQDLLATIQKNLEAEKKRVLERLEELKAQDPFSSPDRVNDNAASDTDAKEESTHDRYAAMAEEMQVTLSEVESALERISKGTYGVCESCGKMIDSDRLSAIPTAKLCIECSKKQD